MKLHHFVSSEAAKVTKEATRIQEIGKSFTPPRIIRTVAEAAKSIPQKAAEVVKADQEGDLTQQMRDYAIQQLEHSEHSSHLHKRIRHYD